MSYQTMNAAPSVITPLLSSVNLPDGSYDHLSQAAQDALHKARNWIQVELDGSVTEVRASSRQVLADRFGCNFRDLRLLDPSVSSTPTAAVFVRAKSIIVNLESIRLIIEYDRATVVTCPTPGMQLNILSSPTSYCQLVKELVIGAVSGSNFDSDHRWLPFELRALEVALTAAVTTWGHETKDLERKTNSALERLADPKQTNDLNMVRRCKSDGAKLLQRLRNGLDELESLLDEKEMSSLLLTRKAEAAASLQAASANHPADDANAAASHDSRISSTPSESEAAHLSSYPMRTKVKSMAQAVAAFQEAYHESAELTAAQEMLECFEVQIEILVSIVAGLGERIVRWQEQIQLELDMKRNELVLFDLRITVASMCLAFIGAVGAVFGQNLKSGLEESHTAFVLATVGSLVVAAAMCVGILASINGKSALIAI